MPFSRSAPHEAERCGSTNTRHKLILDLAAGRLIERRDRADKALAKKPNANRIHAE